jgi:hypothetical protein
VTGPAAPFIAIAAVFIAGALGLLKSLDQGYGVYISMSWFAPGIFVPTPVPRPRGALQGGRDHDQSRVIPSYDAAQAQLSSPAERLALQARAHMQQVFLAEPSPDAASRDSVDVRGFRDPTIEVFAADVAGWGPNWRENRIIRPFANRPRPDGIRRHSVQIGPQRGAGSVYVVGWLSDQESDFDFILHIGNGFWGGWGDIDWRVQGYYADIQPFPSTARGNGEEKRTASETEPAKLAQP